MIKAPVSTPDDPFMCQNDKSKTQLTRKTILCILNYNEPKKHQLFFNIEQQDSNEA
jgi:hypothetical protein